MKTNRHRLILLFCICFSLMSCEKELYINLNESNQRYVIEANLSTISNETEIRITQTLNFDQDNNYPMVSNAIVSITDTTMQQTYTLREQIPGVYKKIGLSGVEGHTYRLNVKIGDELYTATSTIPIPFPLDSLQQLNLAGQIDGGGPPTGMPGSGTTIRILPIYKNSTGTDKYFQFVITKNDSLQNAIIPRSDLASSPASIPFPLFVKARKNDTLQIDMQFIDKKMYEYLYGLNRNLGQFSATPSNPASNISNGAFGYFKAHTSTRRILVIK